jgi:phosphoglycerate kinase
MTRKLSVSDLQDLTRKRIFCRVDFNVPIEDGRITDDARIAASLPTIQFLCARSARVVLATHLGRPKGKPRAEFSLAPVANHLALLLGQPVRFTGHTIGGDAEAAVSALAPGQVLLLENLRFHPGEETNDPQYVDALARLGDVYVNDAFGSAHRAHASTVGVPDRLKPAVAGFLMQAELDHLGQLLQNPPRPFLTILGGAKVSDKIELIQNLLPRVDGFLVGGAMAYTFLKAQGHTIGKSRVESEKLAYAKGLLDQIVGAGKRILLPLDHVATVGDDVENVRTTSGVDLTAEETGMDIGPRTATAFTTEIGRAGTVLWNGPLGRFELPAFSQGSRRIAQALAESRAVSVVGGGDTGAAVHEFGLASKMTHVSTGGGASLEFLSGLPLPGVDALDDAP